MSTKKTEMLQRELRLLLEQERASGESGLLSFYQNVEEKLRGSYPQTVFRYRSCKNKNHINALEARQIWLAHPNAFNDPYDVLIFFDIADNIRKVKNLKGDIAEKIARLFCEMTTPSESEKLYNKMVACVEALSGDHKHRLEQKLNNELSAFEAKKTHFSNDFKDILRNSSHLRIACFSETVINPPMWAHYADNGSGFAIEYKTDYLRSICHKNSQNKTCISRQCSDFTTNCPNRYAGHLFPVIYSHSRYDLSSVAWKIFLALVISSSLIGDKLKLSNEKLNEEPTIYHKLSLFKAESWKYENEWRLIAHAAESENHISFICDPVAIYLGSNISTDDEDKLLKIIDDNNNAFPDRKIPVYKMKVNFQNRKNELELEDNPLR